MINSHTISAVRKHINRIIIHQPNHQHRFGLSHVLRIVANFTVSIYVYSLSSTYRFPKLSTSHSCLHPLVYVIVVSIQDTWDIQCKLDWIVCSVCMHACVVTTIPTTLCVYHVSLTAECNVVHWLCSVRCVFLSFCVDPHNLLSVLTQHFCWCQNLTLHYVINTYINHINSETESRWNFCHFWTVERK